ncbi:MAG TPA: putative Ig domain-containing protein [Myxococcaceae bacterium]|nr:putative Ig domain-containing protein [Myxococcaceae bacterium]
MVTLASVLATVALLANHPPRFEGAQERRASTGEEIKEFFTATDPDGDPLKYRAEGLPPGAEFDAGDARLRWRPRDDQTGRYELRVFASDGAEEVGRAFTLEVVEEWTSFLLPGARYGVFLPVATDEVGVLHGVSLELAVTAWIHRNENRGPSHGRVYLRADLLSSTAPGVPLGLIYAAGFDLSFERNPRRHWLIPFYAVEAGGVVHPSYGHFFQATALVGAHLWTSRNVFLDVSAGYLVAPGALQLFRGWRASAGANVTFW